MQPEASTRSSQGRVHGAMSESVSSIFSPPYHDDPLSDEDQDDVNLPETMSGGQTRLHAILQSLGVETILVGLIALSLITITIETDRTAAGLESLGAVQYLDSFVLAMYTFELLCKFYIWRCRFFCVPWNCLDFMIVAADYGMIIIEAALSGSNFSFSFLRALRLLRLARSARVIRFFPSLSLMAKGFFATLKVVASGLMFLSGSLLVIGVLSVQILHPVNQRVQNKGLYDGCDRCGRAFSSTANAVLTFTQQIITGDSWGTVSIPVIEEEPATAIFFVVVFVLIQFMVLNVILSMVVDSLAKAAADDTERILKAKARLYKETAKQLENMCAELDADQSGLLTKPELMQGFIDNPKFKDIMTLMEIDAKDLDAVFGILDIDGNGDLSYTEFVSELYKMKAHDSHTLLVFIQHYVMELKSMLLRERREMRSMATGDSVETPADPHPGGAIELDAARAALRSPPGALPPSALMETRRSVDDLLQEVQRSLRSDLAHLAQDLGRKIDDRTGALRQLKAEPPGDARRGEEAGLSSAQPHTPPSDCSCEAVWPSVRPTANTAAAAAASRGLPVLAVDSRGLVAI